MTCFRQPETANRGDVSAFRLQWSQDLFPIDAAHDDTDRHGRHGGPAKLDPLDTVAIYYM